MTSIEQQVTDQIKNSLDKQLLDKQLIAEGKLVNIENISSNIVVKTSKQLKQVVYNKSKNKRIIPLSSKYSKPIKGLRFN